MGIGPLVRGAAVLALALATAACWIPLPQETAVVVEVYDAQGRPVNGAHVLVDGGVSITGQSAGNEGRVFLSLNEPGIHTVALDPSFLLDPQGGLYSVPLASQVSGEPTPISFANRPFAGGTGDVIPVNVAKGFISVVTIYLADMLEAPADNQWLTDGDRPSPFRSPNGVDEFAASPSPTFWWRPDPSASGTVVYTVQLWRDGDGDIRYPLGVRDGAQYLQVTDPLQTGYIEPAWQVPNAGVQDAYSLGGGRVRLVAATAGSSVPPLAYDVYYAPVSLWSNIRQNNLVLRDVAVASSGGLLTVDLGPGTANPTARLRNGVRHRFALGARDAAANADSPFDAFAHSARSATPAATATLGSLSGLSVLSTDEGGRLRLSVGCGSAVGETIRFYVAPRFDWGTATPARRGFDPRFLRGESTCSAATVTVDLAWLVNGVSYMVGVEPADAANNVGAGLTVSATPTNSAAADTVKPYWSTGGAMTATTTGQPPGTVLLTFDTVGTESSAFLRRLYYGPGSLSVTNSEAREHVDIVNGGTTTHAVSDLPNGVPWSFAIRAIDGYGNASTERGVNVTLADPQGRTGPRWATDDAGLLATVGYPAGEAFTHPLGMTYRYGGPPLSTDGGAEYVWRVVQDTIFGGAPDPARRRESKLGAFYCYSGFMYATTAVGGLNMSSPSDSIHHREVLRYVETALAAAEVMGTPFDSSDPSGYRQRTVEGFLGQLEAGDAGADHIVIRYVTDEDGAVQDAGLDTDNNGTADDYGAILEIVPLRSQGLLSPTPPRLQRKVIQALYRGGTDSMEIFPGSLNGVFFSGSLAVPDSLDPLW